MKKIFCAAMIITCLACYASANAADSKQEVLAPSVLSEAVARDLEAAKAKYLNKTLVVRGVVGRTYTSRYLTPNVELAGTGSKVTFVLPYGGVTRGMGQLSNFKAGQTVTMQGRVIGMNEEVIVFKETVVIE